jgi:ABC-2 type transport system permease protein
MSWVSTFVVLGYLVVFLVLAVWGYDPARGLVGRRGGAE